MAAWCVNQWWARGGAVFNDSAVSETNDVIDSFIIIHVKLE